MTISLCFKGGETTSFPPFIVGVVRECWYDCWGASTGMIVLALLCSLTRPCTALVLPNLYLVTFKWKYFEHADILLLLYSVPHDHWTLVPNLVIVPNLQRIRF